MKIRGWVYSSLGNGVLVLVFLLMVSHAAVAEEANSDAGNDKPAGLRWLPRLRETASTTDWLLASRARAALWRDKELGRLSLEVTVRQGVASLYGPIPEAHYQKRAIEVVRGIRGVAEVRDYTRVRATPQRPIIPANREPQPPPEDLPPIPVPVKEPAPAVLTKQPNDKGPTEGGLLQWRPREAEPTPAAPPQNNSADLWRPVKK